MLDLSCTGLRAKTFGIPDPFVKLTISNKRGCPKQSHHGQLAITSVANHTCSHHWINEVISYFIVFIVYYNY